MGMIKARIGLRTLLVLIAVATLLTSYWMEFVRPPSKDDAIRLAIEFVSRTNRAFDPSLYSVEAERFGYQPEYWLVEFHRGGIIWYPVKVIDRSHVEFLKDR